MSERYGLDLSDSDARQIISMILKGFGKFKGTNISGRERYIVGWRGILIDVIYDPTENLLITAYPPRIMRQRICLRTILSEALIAS
jgi:hypothetical protein